MFKQLERLGCSYHLFAVCPSPMALRWQGRAFPCFLGREEGYVGMVLSLDAVSAARRVSEVSNTLPYHPELLYCPQTSFPGPELRAM